MRGASLTWSRNNLLACGCCKASECVKKYGGITTFGMEVVELLEKKKMFIDVSHLNDDGFKELAIVARRPFLATHSNSRTIHYHYRNLTDTQLEILARQGGIVGINNCRQLVGATKEENPIKKMYTHMEHERKIIGSSHIGFGFDFCDSYDCARYKRTAPTTPDDILKNHSGIPLLTATLLSHNIPESDITQILGQNFINYFKRNLPTE